MVRFRENFITKLLFYFNKCNKFDVEDLCCFRSRTVTINLNNTFKYVPVLD